MHDHLEKEKITEEELMSAVRSAGVASLDHVREVYIEPDGMISVLTHQPRGATGPSGGSGVDRNRDRAA